MSILFFVIVPVVTNGVLALTSFFLNPADFYCNPFICNVTAGVACGAAVSTLIGFAIHDIKPGPTLGVLAVQGIMLILIFVGIYRGYGLLYGGSMQLLLNDGTSALYFSVVTWTTVGYGDFSPPPDIRLIAAAEALLGYVFLGTTVGLGTVLLSK